MTSRATWVGLFGGYFLLQALIRVLIGPALELDEAEAFWFARDLAPGYNAQPPLYFWLQWVFFQIFGEGIVALALLKAVLLWGALTALFLWLSRQVPVRQAGVAVLALGLLPQVVWEAQRALTHSVLVLALAVAFVLAFHRMLLRGTWRDAIVLGIVTGLGLVAKYNFGLVPAGFLIWAAVARQGRRLDWRRVAVAMAIALAIAAPVAIWAFMNPGLAGASLHKLGLDPGGFAGARAQGLLSLAIGVVSFLALAILVLGGLWLARDRQQAVRPEAIGYLAGGVAGGIALLLAGILLAGVTAVKDRWLLPVLWPLVPAAVLWLWPVLKPRQRRGLGIGAGLCWVVAMLALPYATLRDPGYRVGDFAGLEAAMAAIDPAPENVVSGMHWVLGNLALRNPEMPIVWAGRGGGPGLILAPPGDGARIAERLGLVAGPAVIHKVIRGARVTVVEITPVAEP
jgi:4-amino-4-deoxy-L-arabinose transferase-like glycosyltransferase